MPLLGTKTRFVSDAHRTRAVPQQSASGDQSSRVEPSLASGQKQTNCTHSTEASVNRPTNEGEISAICHHGLYLRGDDEGRAYFGRRFRKQNPSGKDGGRFDESDGTRSTKGSLLAASGPTA